MATENLKMGVEKHNILDKLKKNEGQDKTISDRQSVTNNSKGNPKDNVMHKVMLAPIRMDSGNTPCKEGQMTVDLGFVEVVDDTGKHNKHGSDIQRGKALVQDGEEECDDDSSEGDNTEDDEMVAESLIDAFSPEPKQLANPV